ERSATSPCGKLESNVSKVRSNRETRKWSWLLGLTFPWCEQPPRSTRTSEDGVSLDRSVAGGAIKSSVSTSVRFDIGGLSFCMVVGPKVQSYHGEGRGSSKIKELY